MAVETLFDLKVRDLVVTGDTGRDILRIPALAVPAGTSIGIMGPSGAGKSTLLFALAGLAEKSRGEVVWGNTDILNLSDTRRAGFRRQHIGLIFQDYLLFEELDAIENAALQALFTPRRRRPELQTSAKTLLRDLDVPMEARSVASYSGGERQRVAMARALAHDPMIVLADEPTANLHRKAADALIEDLVTRVRERGCSLIAASHDKQLLDRLDHVVSLADGAIAGAPSR